MALRVIAEQGLGRFTTLAVAREIGVTDAALFRHFGTMQEIVLAVIDRVEEILFAEFPPDGRDPLERLGRFFQQRVDVIRARPGLARLVTSDALAQAAPPLAVDRVLDLRRRSVRFVADVPRAGRVRELACGRRRGARGKLSRHRRDSRPHPNGPPRRELEAEGSPGLPDVEDSGAAAAGLLGGDGGWIHLRVLGPDHARLDDLLAAAIAGPGAIDLATYGAFREGLLRHIAWEEKILTPAISAARAGEPPLFTRRLRIDHGALAALLVTLPTAALAGETRKILVPHNSVEEGPSGLYEACDAILPAAERDDLVERMRNYPPVKVARYNDGPRACRTAVEALRISALQSERRYGK